MDKSEQETPFSEKTIKFRPRIVCIYIYIYIYIYLFIYIGPLNRPQRLLKGWHLFPFHTVYSYAETIYGKGLKFLQVIYENFGCYLTQEFF